jgi:hypothetical protein
VRLRPSRHRHTPHPSSTAGRAEATPVPLRPPRPQSPQPRDSSQTPIVRSTPPSTRKAPLEIGEGFGVRLRPSRQRHHPTSVIASASTAGRAEATPVPLRPPRPRRHRSPGTPAKGPSSEAQRLWTRKPLSEIGEGFGVRLRPSRQRHICHRDRINRKESRSNPGSSLRSPPPVHRDAAP